MRKALLKKKNADETFKTRKKWEKNMLQRKTTKAPADFFDASQKNKQKKNDII